MTENRQSITDGHFSEEEMRTTAAEAVAELGELAATRGLEHIFDEPLPGTEPSNDLFTRLAEEYNYVASSAPEAVSAHIHFGKLFIVCGMYEQAATALAQAVSLKPLSADAHCLYARSLAALDRLDEARKHYEEACRLDARLFESRYELEILNIRAASVKDAAEGASRN